MSHDVILRTARLGFPWQPPRPVLFCVHHADFYPRGNAAMGPAASLAGRDLGMDFAGKDGWRMYHGEQVPGFPQHPHRGFETITIMRRGYVDHSDSLGATARFGQGDVQWLTAGRGIVHCEMFPLLEQERDNTAELFQIWLNLPRANKMVEPHFSMQWKEQIPTVVTRDVNGCETAVDIIAGTLGDVQPLPPPPHSWASAPESDIAVWTVQMQAGAVWTLPPARAGTNRMLFFFVGKTARIASQSVDVKTSIALKPDAAVEIVAGDAACEFLLLQGKPIDEPVVQHGPFVMNSAAEIQQAFDDYRRTAFGGWPFDSDEPVHARDAGRFAKHPDGRLEKPTAG